LLLPFYRGYEMPSEAFQTGCLPPVPKAALIHVKRKCFGGLLLFDCESKLRFGIDESSNSHAEVTRSTPPEQQIRQLNIPSLLQAKQKISQQFLVSHWGILSA
jgi:hypothetical protein